MVGVGLKSLMLSGAPSFTSSASDEDCQIGLKNALPGFFSPGLRCIVINFAPVASFKDPDRATSLPSSALASRGFSTTLAAISDDPERTFNFCGVLSIES